MLLRALLRHAPSPVAVFSKRTQLSKKSISGGAKPIVASVLQVSIVYNAVRKERWSGEKDRQADRQTKRDGMAMRAHLPEMLARIAALSGIQASKAVTINEPCNAIPISNCTV